MSDINLCDCPEHWMEITNKKGKLYLLSSKGRLYSYHTKRFVGRIKKNGYIEHCGFFGGSSIHRLVYRYFYQINIEKYDRNYNEIDHINTIKNHNCVCNLRCVSCNINNNNSITLNKKKKCYFCNSVVMDYGNFQQHHSNGKCLFK